jgi:hypothetical protein
MQDTHDVSCTFRDNSASAMTMTAAFTMSCDIASAINISKSGISVCVS